MLAKPILRELQSIVGKDRCLTAPEDLKVYSHELSKKISRRKMEDIEATGASVVVTGRPGCMLQLKDQLAQKNSSLEVKHLIQVVDEAGG